MGKLNVASFGLFVCAIGHWVFYGCLFPHLRERMVNVPLLRIAFVPLLLPWFIVFAISFCRRPPFGPRLFRRSLMLAMASYLFFGILVEILHLVIRSAPAENCSFTLARIPMYVGASSFIVFIRACVQLKRIERTAATSNRT